MAGLGSESRQFDARVSLEVTSLCLRPGHGAVGGPLRLGPWKEAGLVPRSCLAAWAGPQVLLWCSPPSAAHTVSYAREWTGSDPTRPVPKDQLRLCGSSSACEPRVPQAGSQVHEWVRGMVGVRAGPPGAREQTSCSHPGLWPRKGMDEGVCDKLPGVDSSVPAGEAHFPPQFSVRAGCGRSQPGWRLGPDKPWGTMEDRGLCGRRSVCAGP